ncbi:MAG: hypothetical protein WCW84_12125, partial [Sulfurimonas sp.]
GNYDASSIKYYSITSGKELSAEKATKKDPSKVRTSTDAQHSILYYVNKNDPLGTTPPDFSDPMLPRWEGSFDPNADNTGLQTSFNVSPDQLFISTSEYYKGR